jgi:glycerol-3-phosphate dehydrogenase subunit C
MREGSLEAPTRHVIAREDPDFTDRAKTEAEMHRIFDICHTCRRCFNLCDAFPRLFDLIDNSESGELDMSHQPTTRRSPTPARCATCAL